MNLFRKFLAVASVLVIAFIGYSLWRHFHDAPVRKNALIDQQTAAAQQELKRANGRLYLALRRAAKAEAAAIQSAHMAALYKEQADSMRARRAAHRILEPVPIQPDSAAQYWKAMYDDTEVENVSLRAAFDEQKHTAVLYQGLYVNTMRSLTDLGNAASGVNNALTAEHDARQCKILGLISCPSRGASFAAGVLTVLTIKVIASAAK